MIRIAITNASSMYICLCNAITAREIREAAELGITDFEGLKDGLGVATCCGTCEPFAREILEEVGACKPAARSREFA